MPPVSNKQGLGIIWQGCEHSRATQCAEYDKISLNTPQGYTESFQIFQKMQQKYMKQNFLIWKSICILKVYSIH